MLEDDKAKTIIPPSPTEELVTKIDRRDRLMHGVELFAVLCLVVFNVFVGLRLQQVIDQNNQSTIAARQANTARQDSIKNYIECIVLIQFNQPPVDFTSKPSTKAALDKCATGN